MKHDRGRGKADGQGRNQGQFCSNRSFGQGRGRNCSYAKDSSADGSRPQQSIIATVFDGLERIIDRSRRTIGLLSGRTDRYLERSKELENLPPGGELPDLPAETREKPQLMKKNE